MKPIIQYSLLGLPVLASAQVTAQEKQPTPNLVFIMADQYRGDAIGCIGKEPVKTPTWTSLPPKELTSPMLSVVIRYHRRQEEC